MALTTRAYNFSNINSAHAFCQKHRSVYVKIVIVYLINLINIKARFFRRDVRAVPHGGGGGGGCNTPQKKVKEGGPTCGEGALACWNCKIF